MLTMRAGAGSFVTVGCAAALLFGVAGIIEAENSLAYKFQYYEDNNNCIVRSNTAHVSKKLSESTNLNVGFLVDAITAASRREDRGTLLPVDAITAASPISEQRKEYSATLSYTRDFWKAFKSGGNSDNPTVISVTAMDSRESDYRSYTISAGISQDLFERNTTLGFRYNRNFDQYNPPERFLPDSLNPSWNYLGEGRRKNIAYTASLTQGLTLTTVASVVLGYGFESGYLDRPYYVVSVGPRAGVMQFYQEHYPESKKSGTVVAKLNQYVPLLDGSSIQADYRYYEDGWGIKSHTAGIAVYFRFLDNIIVRPDYRYYAQTQAFFYAPYYEIPQAYMTADFKHSEFSAHTIGGKVSFELRDFVKPPASSYWALYPTTVDIGFDRYLRSSTADIVERDLHYNYWDISEGFRAYWIEAGVAFSF